jgi:hypothetical protein
MKRLPRKQKVEQVEVGSAPEAPLITPDLAKISEALSAMPCKGAFGKDDWERVINAVWFASKGSEEGLRLADEWSRDWVFYKPEDVKVRWENCAKYPPADVNENTLFALAARKAERERKLADLSQLAEADYEDKRRAAAKDMGWRTSKLDEEVKRRRRRSKSMAAPSKPAPSVEELAKKARKEAEHIIAHPNVLDLFGASISYGLAGEIKNAKLTYLCTTSRLFNRPMNLAIKGLSSIGKSHLRDRVLDYIPPEDVIAFTMMSEKALIYLPDDLAHKILSMDEAVGAKERETQDYLIREIISSGRIVYYVPMKSRDDHGDEQMATQKIVKEGPIMFVTTTTKARLHPEIETRILSVETDDTRKQTRRVMEKVAQIDGGLQEHKVDLTPWHAHQRWLALGERRVNVPFALTLAQHPKLYDKAVRMRRDIRQVLTAIKANALLNREHRKRDKEGRIIATIRDDYATVYELMADRLAHGAGTKLKPNDQRVLDAVTDKMTSDGVTVATLVRELKLHQTTIQRRLGKLVVHGFIENLSPGKGGTGRYRVSAQPPSVGVLPTPAELRKARDAEGAAKERRK